MSVQEQEKPRRFKQLSISVKAFIKKRQSRAAAANLLMASFIIMTSIGAFFIDTSVGFITLGVSCGLLGLLLGLE